MAEAAKAPQNAPAPSLPEPDLDVLLGQLPQFKEAFGPPPTAESGDTKPADSTPEVPDTSTETVPDESGLPPAEPLEEPEETVPPEGEPAPEEKKTELPESVQKRIDKLTAQKKTAEERVTALEAENAQLKSQAIPPVAPTPQNPLADIETHAALSERAGKVQQAKTWLIQNLEGGDVDMGEGKTQYLDAQRVRALLAQAEEMLTIHIPARYNHLNTKAQFDSEASKAYPSLFKAGTKENIEYGNWLRVFPECRKFPDIALIIGDAIVGRDIRFAKAKKGEKGNGQSPPLATPAPASAPRVAKPRTLSSEELGAIATDTTGSALNSFVDQLIAGGREAQAQARTRSQR